MIASDLNLNRDQATGTGHCWRKPSFCGSHGHQQSKDGFETSHTVFNPDKFPFLWPNYL